MRDRLVKTTFLLLTILSSSGDLSAQLSDEGLPGVLSFGNTSKRDVPDVEITAIVKSTGTDTAVIEVTAVLPDGYYIYSMNPSFGENTEIELTELSGLTEAGDWKADHEPKVVMEEVLGQNVEKFFDKVVWSKPLKGSLTAETKVEGKLNGQYCGSGENGVPGECRPIRDKKFKAKAELTSATGPSDSLTESASEPTEQPVQVVTSVDVSPKIGYGKNAQSGLIDFKISVTPEAPVIGETVTLSIKAAIRDDKYHTYAFDQPENGSGLPTSIEWITTEGAKPVDKTPVPNVAPEEKTGADSAVMRLHHGEIEWTQRFDVTDKTVKLAGDVMFQLCDDKKCLAPSKAPFELTLLAKEGNRATTRSDSGAAEKSPQPNGEEPAVGESMTPIESGSKKDTSYFALILAGISGGLLSLFTPCVYPMLPVTVAFFLKQEEKKAGSSLVLAIVYSLSMVVAFTIFGVGMSFLFGASSTNVLANNPWLNLFFAAVFMAFALMFFGVFEIQIPSWLLTWTSKREASGGLIGVIFMALTFTLVSFTCTFAFVGNIAILAQGGSIVKAIVGMVAFGATFASPFFLLAMFPSVLSKMPKSGGWMNRVKVTIGLVELAMVLKFLSVADIGFSSNGLPVFLDRASFLAGWMAIAFVTGSYLLGLFRLSSDMEVKGVPVLQVLLSIMFFAVGGYIGVGLFGSNPPSGWVWGQIVSLAPPDFQMNGAGSHGGGKQGISIRKDDVLGSVVEHHGLVFGLDFDRAVAEATRSGMPLFVDFTGVNCPNCRNMEHDVLSQPQMINLLAKMVRVQLYCDTVPGIDNREERNRILEFNRNLQTEWFKDSSLPGYAVATSDGKNVLAEFAGYDSTRGVDFERFLSMGLKQFEKVAKKQDKRTSDSPATADASTGSQAIK